MCFVPTTLVLSFSRKLNFAALYAYLSRPIIRVLHFMSLTVGPIKAQSLFEQETVGLLINTLIL